MVPEFLKRAFLPDALGFKLTFGSFDPVSIKDKTADIQEIVYSSKIRNGEIKLITPHTTWGLILQELTSNLIIDYINTSLKIPEDRRSTWFTENRIPWFLENGYIAPTPTDQYQHWCGENPILPKDELDNDFNFGRHLRTVLYTKRALSVPLEDRELVLGRFQRIGVWENDGRDGLGSSGNPKRERTLQIRIVPGGRVRMLD